MTFEQIQNVLIMAGIGAVAMLIYLFLEFITRKIARRKRTIDAG
jgi:hypothetical protein